MPSDLKLSVQSVTPDVTLTLGDTYIGSAYSPQVDVSEIEGGHRVTITSKKPSGIVPDTFDVMDGEDGYSPTVSIESTTSEHTITITDKDGEHPYTVDTYADEESARATAETERATAETARGNAEIARASAETARASAETARADAESARASAETSRADAESARAIAETGRVSAESARATAETGRVNAESARGTAETGRANAESARVNAESARVTAEQGRVNAESARVSAESARATAETGRSNAESARVTAESGRATEWATIKPEAVSATQSALNAATAANAATEAANDAAALATRAAASTWNAGNVLKGTLAEGALLTADDVYAAPPESVSVYGKSTQVTTTGKNLLDLSNRTIVKSPLFSNTTPREMDESYVYDGITLSNYGGPSNVTFTEFDGTYTVTSASSGYGVGLPSPVMPNTSYCASSSGIIGVGFYDADGVFLSGAGGSSTTVAFVTPSGCEWVMLILRPPANVATKYTNIQLETGSTATSYEPYTGGKPAPSPDFPQEINSVDDLALHVCGKNLLNPQHFGSRVRYTVNEDGSITQNSSDDGSWDLFSPLPLPAGTYTLSWLKQRSGQVQIRTSDDDYTTNILAAGTDGFKTFTLASDGGVKIKLGVAVSSYPYTEYVQLEYGTTATAYTPYVGQSVEIPLGNNKVRSLPDGTRDQITLTYQGPSTEHGGFGVFGAELVQNVGESDMGDLAWVLGSMTNDGTGRILYSMALKDIASKPIHSLRCSNYKYIEPVNPWERCTYGDIFMTTSPTVIVAADPSYDSAAAFNADSAGVKLQYALATPQTHDLGTVELPLLPNPLTAWADGSSAQPTLALTYEQDINIVIGELRAALADALTS